jgi:Flp pilus assembly protein TadD
VEAWVSTAVQKRPEALGLSARLGAIWIRQGRFDEAEALYRRIRAGEPDNAEALNGLAWLLALREQGKVPEALDLIDRAIELQGPSPALVDTKAVVLIRAGQFDRAIQDLSKAQGVDPRNPSLALHLAWAYQAGGKTQDARKAFQQAETLGWKPEQSDLLERSFMDRLRQDLGR